MGECGKRGNRVPSEFLKQLAVMVLFWLFYFSAVYFGARWLYRRLRGEPPRDQARVLVGGRAVPAREAWEERDRRLRKTLFRVGVGLIFLPVVLRMLIEIFR